MTTPEMPDIPLPYSVTYYPRPSGHATMHIVEDHRQGSTYRTPVPGGVSTVQMTSNDWHGLRLILDQDGKASMLVAEIPRRAPGTGGGASTVVQVITETGGNLYIDQVPRGAPADVETGFLAGLVVIPIATQ